VSEAENIVGSATAFIDPGVYQHLACGCTLFAHEFDPHGPRLCLIVNADGPCGTAHTVDDFLPRRWPS